MPLSDTALTLLKETSIDERMPSEFVFHDGDPSVPLSTGTMAAVLDRLGVSEATVHGFRSSSRTWAAESGGNYRQDIAEAVLAHMTKDKTAAAYQRGELFDLRTSMMADWDRFLSSGKTQPQT